MTKQYLENTFLNSYYDDYLESDGYTRILFNSGRYLQARELTQLQTIIQKQIERFGRNIFVEGAAVNPGGITVNSGYEFIKLAAATTFPTDTSVLVGTTFVGQTSGVEVRVLEVVEASGSDPATLYVTYTSTSSATAGASPIRMSAGETISNGSYSYSVQSTNTTVNPAIGIGTKVSIGGGDFFAQGFFVFTPRQSIIISKYTPTPTKDLGFEVIQDIVTVDDDNALYDNANDLVPNVSAPGADRFRIRLNLTTRDLIDSDATFIYLGRIEDGTLVDEVQAVDDYNKINDLLALRTKEESGNYNVKPFVIKFEVNDSDDNVLDLNISDGVSYVNGYRAHQDYPITLEVDKARDTVELNNEVVAANYGNYVRVSDPIGIPNVNELELYTIKDTVDFGGSTIGTLRIKAVEYENSSSAYKFYVFDVQMNAGQSFRSAKSIGSSGTSYANIVLENTKAVLKDTANNTLLFPLPNIRPQSLSDISLAVQRRFTGTTNGSGEITLTLTAPGETFTNVNDWIIANEDSSFDTSFSVSGAGTASATISGAPISSSNLEVLAYVNKAQGSSRTKTITETTITNTLDSDGTGTLFLSLGRADIYSVDAVKLTDSDGNDIAYKFTVDNGQRDNFYEIGKLVLRGGQSAPAGNVFARFKYFAHGTSGSFFSVNSYTGQVEYKNIPSHRLSNGTVVQLSDVLDFRAIKDATTGGFTGTNARVNEIPQNTDLITADVTYYQPRYSKLIVDTNGRLSIVSGPSSLTPIFPPTPENSLELYKIQMNPYTLNDSDVAITKVETKRYTMADIGKLENRVERLEELTALSLLELDTANFDVLDSSGANRTKSGFMVDNFKDHFFADTSSFEYSASIDPSNRICRPAFDASSVMLAYDSDQSINTILKGDNVYLKYSEVDLINQPLATRSENVNPYAVITHLGRVTLSPSSDNWSDTRRIAARIIDGGTQTRQISSNLSVNWNNWQWNWGGEITTTTSTSGRSFGNGSMLTTTETSTRTATSSVTSTSTIQTVVGDRVVNVALIPWMRSTRIYFRAEGLRPNTRMFAFFDGVPVSSWVRSESFQRFATNGTQYGNSTNNLTSHPAGATTLYTNDEGVVTGSFFVPNNSSTKFRTGSREFKLLDISVNNDNNALSIARTIFTSSGIMTTVQSLIVSTRIVTTETTTRTSTISRSSTITNSITDRGQNNTNGRGENNQADPLAQSFFINDPDGIYVTSVDLYFKTKDAQVPVQLQIRPVENGIPTSTVVPGSSIFKAPSAVSTSANASAATTFTFEEPVYLSAFTEYAIVVLAESTDYNLYIAETEEFILGSTSKRVTKQPTMGSLFKSQNGSTWTPDQTADMTFRIRRAQFNSTSGTAILENVDIPTVLLDPNPILVDSGSSTLLITHVGHGFSVGDEVTLSGATAFGGISAGSINGTRSITAVDWTGYTVLADSASTSADIGGGTDIQATQNILFDVFVPSIETIVPTSTNLGFAGKFTTGTSFAGTETPYQKATTFSDIRLFDNNFLPAPRMIANASNEATELGAGVRSATIQVSLGTNSLKVSPLIDMQRAALFLINNRIDNQDSVATSGFNVPLNFVSETDPVAGSSASKHITTPVTLNETAVGLKVLIGAHRPSVASFDVYYRTAEEAELIEGQNWVLATLETPIPSDEAEIYRDYEYLIGGQAGNLTPFTQFQLKIVFNSTNSSRVPILRDLRVIALSV